MLHLLLIKHSMPTIVEDRPAPTWRLSADGQMRCQPLAKRLAVYLPTVIISSTEPKAIETAELVAARLGLPFETAEGLHEHERSGVPFFGTEIWHQLMAQFFAQPDGLVLGDETETANQAFSRFHGAVTTILERCSNDTIAIVAHGTVISLYVAHVAAIDPFSLWQSLGLPSFVALTRPELAIEAIVDDVT